MEGQIHESSDLWLFNFRKKISSCSSPLEFAKNALLYDPYYPNKDENNSFQGLENKETQQTFRSEFKCTGVTVMDVASVLTCGRSSFISCSDVKINLYKIYIYLSEALKRLKTLDQYENNDKNSQYSTYLDTLNYILNRFNDYIKISMNLSENVVLTPLRGDKRQETHSNSNVQKSTKFSEITSKFKVDQDQMRKIFRFDSDDTGSTDSSYYRSKTTTLLWSFYRDANCTDIFSLLCYTLFTGNTFAYKSILENFNPCMKSHIRSNWKVLLSYVPISFEFKEYQYIFESILFDKSTSDEWNFEVTVDEDLLVSFTDWCLWRIFLIIKYTNSSYFLLIKFLKNLFKLLGSFENSSRINAKFQVLNFLKFIIKQYFIYKSFNSNNVYKNHLKQNKDKYNDNKEDLGEMEFKYMSFFEYLDLDASKKLGLFCEFDVSSVSEDCNCSEEFKDKHKIYKYCLNCKTRNLCNKLKSFFILINPGGDTLHSDDESGVNHFQYEQNIEKQFNSLPLNEYDSLYNEYLSVDDDFRKFYESLLNSYNSGLNDYISGISETFMKELNVHSFEILYSLSSVLLETGFKNKVFNIFINTIYTNQCKYNFLENYFLIKSTFNLICTNSNLNASGSNFNTSNTLFKLLKYFDTSKPKNNKKKTSYSSYRHLSNLLRNITSIYYINTSNNYHYDNDNINSNTDNKENYHKDNNNDSKENDDKYYDDELKLYKDQKYTPEVVVCSINCQLDFVESLLNLLSLLSVDTPTKLEVTPLELVMGLVNEEYFLVLLQKVLLFIVDLSLLQTEFSICLMELFNLSSYLSYSDFNTIHSMFFYTIASKNNLNYLNQQLQLWFQSYSHQDSRSNDDGLECSNIGNDEVKGVEGLVESNDLTRDSKSNEDNISSNSFLEFSLDCVLNSVYRMDLSCGINLFHLFVSYCKFVPQNNKFYTTLFTSNALSIYSVISLYLNYTNFSLNNLRENKEHGDYENRNDNNNNSDNDHKEYNNYNNFNYNQNMNKLDMLVTLSKVYKCMLIFESYNLMNNKNHESLEYRLYNNVHLVDLTLSTLISVIDSNYLYPNYKSLLLSSSISLSNKNLSNRKLYGSNVVKVLEKKETILMLVFRCIIEHVLENKLYTLDFFNNLKIAIGELCPNQISFVLFNIIDVLSNINEQVNLESNDYLKSNGSDEKLNGLLVNLLFIIYFQSYNFLFVSNLLQLCVTSQLSNSLRFLYNHLINTNPNTDSEIDSYVYSENYNKDDYMDRGERLDSVEEEDNNKDEVNKDNEVENEEQLRNKKDVQNDDSKDYRKYRNKDENKEKEQDKHKYNYYHDEEDERLEIEMGELFNFNNEDYTDRSNKYDENDFRKDVLTLLDPSRSDKVKSWGSIGKLANKLGHNVASEFISAAIEKAEGELLNIAKKSHKFDMLKDKLFYQKKEQSVDKSMYLPVLNYFESTPLYPVNFVDQENLCLNELLQYRNLKEITVSSMVSVNIELACQMVMENCCYSCNTIFLKDLQEVYNKSDLKRVYEFLEVLMGYLKHSKWSPGVLEKLETVKRFLKLFLGFPENLSILVSSFVYNREYRLTLFKNIPSFLACNLQLVQEIYKNLEVFYDFDNFKESVSICPKSTENLEEYLFGPVMVERDVDVVGENGKNRNKQYNNDKEYNNDNNEEVSLNNFGNLVEFDYMDEYVEVLFNVYEEIFLDDFNIESFMELEPLFLLNHEKYLYFLLKLYYNLTIYNNASSPSSIHSSFSISMTSIHSINTPRTTGSRGSGVNVELNNSRFVMIRKFIYNFLQVYPNLKDSFSMIYKAESSDVIKLLETVLNNVPEFDLTVIDNFELFKQNLINYLNLNNFFFVAESFEKLDPSFSVAIYSKLELKLRPHSNELVDCTRMLFEYDLSNSTL